MVFVVDDDASVRESLARVFAHAGYQAESYASAAEFLNRPPCDGPSCLVLDLQMPGLDGLALQQALVSAGNPVPIVFITGHGDVPTSVQAMKGGAVDFLSKPFETDALLDAVAHALDRSRKEHETLDELARVRSAVATLTPREREVLRHVVAGKRNKQIAAELGTTEKTIKVHRSRVMEKMGAGSIAELVRRVEILSGDL